MDDKAAVRQDMVDSGDYTQADIDAWELLQDDDYELGCSVKVEADIADKRRKEHTRRGVEGEVRHAEACRRVDQLELALHVDGCVPISSPGTPLPVVFEEDEA